MIATVQDNLAEILAALEGVRSQGNGHRALCPVHDDTNPSLDISIGDNGGVVMYCQSCEATGRQVIEKLGLPMSYLAPPVENGRTKHNGNGQAAQAKVASTIRPGFNTAAEALSWFTRKHGANAGVWKYHDSSGSPVGLIVRLNLGDGEKEFRPISKIDGTWHIKGMPEKHPMYNLPGVIAADVVVIGEGEKVGDAVNSVGLVGTTSAHGAKSPQKTDWSPCAGKTVIHLADNDPPGRKYREQVTSLLQQLNPPPTIRWLDLPNLPEGGDFVDWLEQFDGAKPEAIKAAFEKLVAELGATPSKIDAKPERQRKPKVGPDEYNKFTDLGNAQRLVEDHGNELAYCHPWKKALTFDGRYWALDVTGAAERMAKNTVRKLWRDAAKLKDKDLRSAMLEHAERSERRERIGAMLALAYSEPKIPIIPSKMDSHPWLFNCDNGTVDLKTGKLSPHNREHYLTKICPHKFDPAAECEQFHAFLNRIFDGKLDLIRFNQRLMGVALVGQVVEHILPIFYGTGSNGKSVFVETMMYTLGQHYADKAVSDLLLAKRNDSHPTERADLHGKRLIICTETSDGRRLDESMVKELTGGDTIKARRMKEDFWSFQPSHTPILVTNHKPVVRGTDHGIWRRLRLVPFNVTIPDAEQDKLLADKLKAEAPGILAWAVRGCLDWQQQGLGEPEEVRAATAAYRSAEDTLAQFIGECCTFNRGFKVKASSIRARYEVWAKDRGEDPISGRRFGEELSGREVTKRISNGVWYEGIGLNDD